MRVNSVLYILETALILGFGPLSILVGVKMLGRILKAV